MSWLIAGIELFRPPRATRPPLLLLLLLLLFYTRLNKRLSRECVYWKAIITTHWYLGFGVSGWVGGWVEGMGGWDGCYQEAIYDIGTEILNFQCFCIMENHIFSKSIIFSGIGSIFRALSFGTIKTRFKAFGTFFWKFACELGFASYVFSSHFAPGGRLSTKITDILPPEGDLAQNLLIFCPQRAT